MTDQEQNRFEAELRERRPRRVPEDLWSRLLAPAARPSRARQVASPWSAPVAVGLQRVLRFLVPVAGVAVLTLLLWHRSMQRENPPMTHSQPPASAATRAQADDVKVAQDLVTSFDTVAKLPSGEPVRFRCRQWVDKVVLRDNAHGLVLEQRTPRVEIVPVGFETY